MSNINADNINSNTITVTNLNVTYINGVPYNSCGSSRGYYVPCPDCDYVGPNECDCGEPCDYVEPSRDECDCFVPSSRERGSTVPTTSIVPIGLTEFTTEPIGLTEFTTGLTTGPIGYNGPTGPTGPTSTMNAFTPTYSSPTITANFLGNLFATGTVANVTGTISAYSFSGAVTTGQYVIIIQATGGTVTITPLSTGQTTYYFDFSTSIIVNNTHYGIMRVNYDGTRYYISCSAFNTN